jgi:hypothetical protein
MNDPSDVWRVADDLLGSDDVAHGSESSRSAVRHQVGPPPLLPQPGDDPVQATIPILVPGYVMDDRPEQPIEEDVAGFLVASLC